jgi:cob(I)alamin adenosyltransferase
MFKDGHLNPEPIIDALSKRPKMQSVMITGRTMAVSLQEVADTISVVQDEKHAYRQGVKAQAGIEF